MEKRYVTTRRCTMHKSQYSNTPILQYSIRLLLLLSLTALPAFAHHFKGLPHFNYFENYPQVPQDEFLGQSGDFEFSLVVYDFQGIEREDTRQPNDVRLYLIAYNLRAGSVYNGPASIEILDHGKPLYSERLPSSQEESIYTTQQILPDEGKYSLRITLHDAGDLVATIPFVLSSQKVHWGKWLVGSLVGLVAVAAIGSRRARVIQDRKARVQQEQGSH